MAPEQGGAWSTLPQQAACEQACPGWPVLESNAANFEPAPGLLEQLFKPVRMPTSVTLFGRGFSSFVDEHDSACRYADYTIKRRSHKHRSRYLQPPRHSGTPVGHKLYKSHQQEPANDEELDTRERTILTQKAPAQSNGLALIPVALCSTPARPPTLAAPSRRHLHRARTYDDIDRSNRRQ
jgi:hypothetical protein